ncbi:MAG: amino acid transporter [Roseivirga sp.]|jgi:amino acid transporter
MAKSNKFGTFGGVFAPSILTILGVIMYLRLPTIVGEAGLLATIGIIVVAHLISITTGLSVSSIATDKKVEAGGTYYMISRSLGLPIGGTLGLALFVGLSFSVSLYLIGFSESFLSFWELDNGINSIRLTGSIVLLVVTTVTFISTSLALKTQYFIMAAIVLSLISIFAGSHELGPNTSVALPTVTTAVPLMLLFGVFFPAVTGFEAGVSMSGDLKDPKRAIPRGAIMAIVVGFVVYIILAVFLSLTVSGYSLINNPQILLDIALVPELVIAGVWGATLSSALGSILGAPRILQATAVDKITGNFFAKGYGTSNEPRNALLLTFLIAEAGILIGDLDVIARVVSIFFITTYGFLNLSCAFETWTSSDFRPQFKVSGWISLLGAAACFIVMIQLDFIATIAASVILGLLYLFLKSKELSLESGDAWSSIWATLVKKGLQRLTKDKLIGRNWRPNIIMFSGAETVRPELLRTGKIIAGNLGILSAFELIESKESFLPKPQIAFDEKDKQSGYFRHTHLCHDIFSGMDEISRIYGFSGIQPNTILMGWSRNSKNKEGFIKAMISFEKQDFNAIYLDLDREKGFGKSSTIDFWWNGSGSNLAFGIYLLRHITSSLDWKAANIRVCYINQHNNDKEDLVKGLTRVLSGYRLSAEIDVVNNELDHYSSSEVITNKSGETDLVIMDLPNGQQIKTYDLINPLINELGTLMLINASSQFENIVIERTGDAIDSIKPSREQLLIIPELRLSKFPQLANDIRQIDERGQKMMELVHEKIFAPVFAVNIVWLEDLNTILSAAHKNMVAALTIEQEYRRKKQLTKIKHDFYFGINEYLNSLIEKEHSAKYSHLAEAIAWYVDKLNSDISLFPKQLKVYLEKLDLKRSSTDSNLVRSIKARKRFQSNFKHRISYYLEYRKFARHFLHHTRNTALHSFLTELQQDDVKNSKFIKEQIEQATEIWNHFSAETSIEFNPKEALSQLQVEVSDAIERQQKLSFTYANRVRLEYRRNLQAMNDTLTRLDANFELASYKKQYKQMALIEKKNQDFASASEHVLIAQFNKIMADVACSTIQSRVDEKVRDFKTVMINTVQRGLIKTLNEYKDHFVENTKFKKINTELDLEEKLNFLPLFNAHTKGFESLIEEAPENLDLIVTTTSGNQEISEVPIAKMIEHYLSTSLILPTEDYLEDLQDQLKSVVLASREMVSLTRFNLSNLENQDDETITKQSEAIISGCIIGLDKEIALINELFKKFSEEIDKNTKKAFEPVSSYRLLSTSATFSKSLRDYQERKVRGKLNKVSNAIREFGSQQVTKLLYSKSRGLIFAKKLTEEDKSSITSRLLDLKDKVSPKRNVLKALPNYYVSLFSGRSSIDKEFWITRAKDEALFKKAIQRYKEGFHGAVLVSGERNSGKSTFCRFQAAKYFKPNRTFQVFARPEGSILIEEFEISLSDATGVQGNYNEIMDTLPEGSVLIINDLELWWERSEHGCQVVETICKLIDNYSSKCLFVINVNSYTAALINQILPFNNYFIEMIKCTSFESEELKELITKRHQSTGLELVLSGNVDRLTEVKTAKLFDAYFNYAKGNPGVALNAWLANIVSVNNERLTIRPITSPSLGALREINEDWQMILSLLILHKHLSKERLINISKISEQELAIIILAMFRSALLVEKKLGIYMVNPNLEPLVVQVLKEKNVI